MNFSYNWLQSFFEKKLPAPEKLAEILTMHFAEVEQIEKKQKDFVLSIDIRPNRAGDCFSHIGIAQEISAILNYQFKKNNFKESKQKKIKGKNLISIEVKDKKACPRYSVKIITNLKVSSSPKWLTERLEACGLKSINNIVDVANYVMLETGQPLHAFDLDKIEKQKIIVRFARKQEKIIALDKNKYSLTKDILIIADEKNPLAIAGIKGGEKAEINKETKTIVLESACFSPKTTRKTSKKLNLKTDASLRFEHGVDPNLTEKAINRAVELIKETAKGKEISGLIDFYPKKKLPRKIKIDFNYIERILGVKIPEKEVKRILNSLGFKISGKIVQVPTKRQDVFLIEDLIEEIGRSYGYWKIPAVSPSSSLIPPKKNNKVFWEEKIKNILKEIGFTETYNYSFYSEKEVNLFNLLEKELIKLKNPLSEEQKYLRTSLIPGILGVIEKNFRQFPKIMVFELGRVFEKISSGLKEKRMLTGVINNNDFFQAKGVIDFLLSKLGVTKISYSELYKEHFSVYRSKKSAQIKINNKQIGSLGEVSPKILSNLNIKNKAILFNIDFEKLLQYVSEKHQYQPISRYPAAIRDIAVLIPQKIKTEQVLNKINRAGGKLIRNIDLFDIYQGKELPENKKNLAFRIVYQAENKTLSSKEIDGLQNKIIKFLEKNPEWSVRK